MCYLVAKDRNAHGCFALKTTHGKHTERVRIEESGTKTDVTRLISARMATEFERGLYYGKNE